LRLQASFQLGQQAAGLDHVELSIIGEDGSFMR